MELALSADGEAIFEETVSIAPDEVVFVDPGVDERGEYELRAVVDDRRTRSYPFSIDEYALESGSNLLVTVRIDDVEIAIEE